MIERLETKYGVDVMRDVLTSLYVSRSGLSEAELQDVRCVALCEPNGRRAKHSGRLFMMQFLHLDNATWLSVYAAIASSLMLRFGLLGFFHDLFRQVRAMRPSPPPAACRPPPAAHPCPCLNPAPGLFLSLICLVGGSRGQAVAVKYLMTDQSKAATCHRLAKHFEAMLHNGNYSVRVVDELPWLLERAGDRTALKNCISHIRLFDKLFQKERKYDLFRYWVAAAAHGPEIAELYTRQLDEFERQNQGNSKEVTCALAPTRPHRREPHSQVAHTAPLKLVLRWRAWHTRSASTSATVATTTKVQRASLFYHASSLRACTIIRYAPSLRAFPSRLHDRSPRAFPSRLHDHSPHTFPSRLHDRSPRTFPSRVHDRSPRAFPSPLHDRSPRRCCPVCTRLQRSRSLTARSR